ncbi:MAG TPA: hypothetical protein VFV85_08820 [Conexibacter sp.]|nr:hypothetical protein [Conexibacter sp.]
MRRRRAAPARALVALTAAAALAALGGCGGSTAPVVVPRPPRGAPPLRAGIVINALDAGRERGAQLARARALGAGWIREELRWGEIERAPGRYDWRRFDALMVAATRARLNVLPLLLGTPWWAGDGDLALPDDPAAFGAFAAHAAARYGPGGSFWREHPELDARFAPRWFELWNEPYTERFSTNGVNPARYAAMVHAATVDGRAANGATRWLMAADLTYEDAAGVRRNWLDALAAADPGLMSVVDGVAVHPYTFGSPDDESADVSLSFRFGRVRAIARELTALGAGRAPLWITEIGWSTCDVRPDCGSESDQAQWLADMYALVRRRPLSGRVRAVFVYDLDDFPGAAADDREGHFGVLRADGTRKPAWSVVRREAQLASR